MNDTDMKLYELYRDLMSAAAPRHDDRQRIVIYHPDEFIELARDNIELRAEVNRLKRLERKYCDEVTKNIQVMDKLRWCCDTLERLNMRVPFAIDATPM